MTVGRLSRVVARLQKLVTLIISGTKAMSSSSDDSRDDGLGQDFVKGGCDGA